MYKIIIGLIYILSLNIGVNAQNKKITFEPDYTTNFPNPERGLAPSIDPVFPAKVTWKFQSCEGYTYTAWTAALDSVKLKDWREKSFSVVMIRYHIAEFRDTLISQAFIKRLDSDFALARQYGFKLIPRFVYNWPKGGPDAPLDIVLSHIQQLKKVFNKNVDVINFVELGFIGSWGEQHHSCNGLLDGMLSPNANTWQIVDSLFNSVPVERMVAFRYPFWKFRYFGSLDDKPTSAVTESEAYSGSKKARWAQHDDCLVCGEWNVGTWNTTRNNAQEIIEFLANDNLYVFQGGEPGDPATSLAEADEDSDGYSLPNHESCERMRWILEKDHWSTMNASYGEKFDNKAYQAWREDGCYDEIALHLGYRFRLVEAQIPRKVRLNEKLNMSITIHNDGWASPHNPRGFELIFRNKKTGELNPMVITDGKSIPSEHSFDPRFWLGGKEYKVKLSLNLPSNINTGEYEVLMNFPDPILHNRPEFSIRLANQKIWEEKTGFNSLIHTIRIQK